MSKQIPPKKTQSAKLPQSLKPRPDLVKIDRKKIEIQSGTLKIKSDSKLAEGTLMSRQTLNRYLNQGEMPSEYLDSLARRLKTTSESLMRTSNFAQAEELSQETVPPRNWDVLELSPATSAANGLTYHIAKLQSTLVDGQFARGKFYDLAGVDQKNQAKIRACLSRHAVVCESCIDAQRIARNRTVIPLGNDTAWWVLDYWIDGFPLDALIYPRQELSHSLIKHLGTEILLSLQELHSRGIVMRELTPDKVIVSEGHQKCTLTDFEMAILTQGTVSVSGRWKDRIPYWAPENKEDSFYHRKPQIVERRDIYSWAAIMIELITGDPLADSKRLGQSLPQAELAKFLIDCRHPQADRRPKSVGEVLEVWNKW